MMAGDLRPRQQPAISLQTPQQRTLQMGCPNKCLPQMFFSQAPKPGSPVAFKNAVSRCLICLTFWEVTTAGEIVNVRAPEERELPVPPPGREP